MRSHTQRNSPGPGAPVTGGDRTVTIERVPVDMAVVDSRGAE